MINVEYEGDEFIYGFYFKKVLRLMKKIQDTMLAPFDITNQQARLVGYIYYSQKNDREICQKDLERVTGLKGSSITSLLQGLEKKGFIMRCSSDTDARTKHLYLTRKGLDLNEAFIKIFQETENILLQGMTEEEKGTLLNLLRKAVSNLE